MVHSPQACSGRKLIAATSTSAGVHTVRGFLQQCCSIEIDENFLCKACFWKVEKGAKSQAVVDAVREEMRSCLHERGLLDEENCLLPNKQAQDATTQTDFIHLLDYDKGSEGICIYS